MLPQASEQAIPFDSLFDFILITCIISFVLIVFGKLFFLIRFRRRKRPEHLTPYITGHTKTELGVAFLLLIWVMVIFYWGWIEYRNLKNPPANAYEINVIGKQWLWEIQYANGRTLTNELVVPRGKPVSLILTSADVIHSFFVPDFRVKQDAVPGMYTNLWFTATQTGNYQVFCAEYCGTAHSKMLATVRVIEPEDFEAWEEGHLELEALAPPADRAAPAQAVAARLEPLAERGKTLFAAKGCNACHSVDGGPMIGPTLLGIVGHEVELSDGVKVKVDENYIRESIVDPNARIVKGFSPMMPTYKGQLSDEEMNSLIAYIKSLQ